MAVIPLLICIPFLTAAVLLCSKNSSLRDFVSYIGAAAVMLFTGVLWIAWLQTGSRPITLFYDTEIVDRIIFGAEIFMMCLVTFLCFKYNYKRVSLLSIIPTVIIGCVEFGLPHKTHIAHMFIDRLSMLMCLIIATIGGLIIIYAIGYMSGYHMHHKEVQNRSNYFLALLFVFMGAMFGFVLAESLIWLFFFWECTSVCSFLLIGYTRAEEAIKNSFRALWMNLFGGLALSIGIFYFAYYVGSLSFRTFIAAGTHGNPFALLPVALMAFAALTKSAQLPFSTWLLGAMVAPTPSSALLHSATMVKAGIYVLLRLSPAMSGTVTGTLVALIGGFTFFVASFMAIAQSDAKRVLAMSTVSNLGLMVACAGTGTPETLWAGVFLMIFHAVSKSLLFLDVGATENTMHSRDIEDMHGMMYFLPKLAVPMFIGIAGMFLAPFGMLISKWAALRAAVDEKNLVLLMFISFGSATTSFYWSKWMGKLISRPHTDVAFKDITRKNEMGPMMIQAVMMIVLCMLFPFISGIYVDPMLFEMFGTSGQVLSPGLLVMLSIIILFVFAIPPVFFMYSRKMHANRKLSYMGGINTGDDKHFVDSFGEEKRLWLSNYYFANRIGIRKIMLPCQLVASAVLIAMFCIILGVLLR
ncbi:MAG: NADH-quinone oxidoreductase subunit L [Firmicutes bacterium]|nr:NADH-quinone oxidoreductase subunit L [Bacillota bacterium]MBQ9604204.1 NADH-quinone oxidoreductase subunit L [Bacillota bacterium]